MDQPFSVVRQSGDHSVVRVWWFAGSMVFGRLVLERYQEFHVTAWSARGDHEYRLAEDLSAGDGTLDPALTAVPADVAREAASRTRSIVN